MVQEIQKHELFSPIQLTDTITVAHRDVGLPYMPLYDLDVSAGAVSLTQEVPLSTLRSSLDKARPMICEGSTTGSFFESVAYARSDPDGLRGLVLEHEPAEDGKELTVIVFNKAHKAMYYSGLRIQNGPLVITGKEEIVVSKSGIDPKGVERIIAGTCKLVDRTKPGDAFVRSQMPSQSFEQSGAGAAYANAMLGVLEFERQQKTGLWKRPKELGSLVLSLTGKR